jgi:hypothetical protein
VVSAGRPVLRLFAALGVTCTPQVDVAAWDALSAPSTARRVPPVRPGAPATTP